MKIEIFLSMIILAFTVRGNCQGKATINYEPYFSAIIVNDIDSSAPWYQSVLGLKLKSEINDPGNGFRVNLLESSTFLLELLELRGSLQRKKILDGKGEGTQIQGHFKTGFKVADIDACLKHLGDLKINIQHVWTDSTSRKRNFLVSDPDGNLLQFFE
jgi:catechol 2,3-dioxygenase-like lactoylglutathione lyase family enzyme